MKKKRVYFPEKPTKPPVGIGELIKPSSETSKNERASKVFGMRADRIGNAIIFDQPCELGYHCPVCVYEHPEGNYDERLRWSEYNSFLWCEVCNKDYPSALCMPDIDRAIDIFLDSVEEKLNELAELKRIYRRIQAADHPSLSLPVEMTVAMAEMTALFAKDGG